VADNALFVIDHCECVDVGRSPTSKLIDYEVGRVYVHIAIGVVPYLYIGQSR
jgi:hypothetical protein